eukprot:TRINITY_DN1914_c1_g1_i1.p1 TRINITY_DN1914_c1_g1~~TRINITY_DN1914_c1_g1_i1.p1  ORF type:complete len:260 (-),score=23.26 TRINITY_DN1914_c1_g1_i1:276-1055(-)
MKTLKERKKKKTQEKTPFFSFHFLPLHKKRKRKKKKTCAPDNDSLSGIIEHCVCLFLDHCCRQPALLLLQLGLPGAAIIDPIKNKKQNARQSIEKQTHPMLSFFNFFGSTPRPVVKNPALSLDIFVFPQRFFLFFFPAKYVFLFLLSIRMFLNFSTVSLCATNWGTHSYARGQYAGERRGGLRDGISLLLLFPSTPPYMLTPALAALDELNESQQLRTRKKHKTSLTKQQTIKKKSGKNHTFSNGYLGSHFDEERSQLR